MHTSVNLFSRVTEMYQGSHGETRMGKSTKKFF